MTVSGRSDFSHLAKFPEVYHGQGITTPPFSGAERPISGQGRDTTYSVKEANNTAAYCVSWPLSAGRAPADPELPETGSLQKKREESLYITYPYARHLHIAGICIYLPSA